MNILNLSISLKDIIKEIKELPDKVNCNWSKEEKEKINEIKEGKEKKIKMSA